MATLQAPSKRPLTRWLALLLGAACILIGAVLVARPFQSLAVLILLVAIGAILTGLNDLTEQKVGIARITQIIGIAWIALGLFVLLQPGLSLQSITLIVAISLVVGGFARAFAAFRAHTDQRAAALLLGGASIILGLVALSWPDITLLVVAVVFGIRLVMFGIARVVDAVRGSTTPTNVTRPQSRFARYAKTFGAALALLAALALAAISSRLQQGAPRVDAFYTAPEEIPSQPGALLRTEPMSRAIPDGAQAWRILYTTTREEGVPALASALVVAPQNLPGEPQPVIAWAHGTTGVDQSCAPSLLKDPFAAGAMPGLAEVIANGWIVVATDYSGLGTEPPHAYLVGSQAGRAVLDAVRAARQMTELNIAEQTVVWGHSQGGAAALWTGILAPLYAPDANVIAVAALAPASDLPGLVDNLDVVKGGSIFASFIMQGYSDTYPDVHFNDYIRPTARILAREMASRCLAEPEVFASVIESLVIDKSIWSVRPTNGPFGQRLQENVPTGEIPAPLLIGQGLTDELVLPSAQAAFVQARCQGGWQVDYRTYAGFDHVGVVSANSPLVPELLSWTQDRLDNKPATPNC